MTEYVEPINSSTNEMVASLHDDDAFTLCGSTCSTVKRSNVPSKESRTISVNNFLNRFEHPTRSLIYLILLNHASSLNHFRGENTMERSYNLQLISDLAPAGSVSTGDIDKALNDTAVGYRYLVEDAKESIRSLLRRGVTENSDSSTFDEVKRMLHFSLSHPHTISRAWNNILHHMNLTEDHAVEIMDAAVLINCVDAAWLFSLKHQGTLVDIGGSGLRGEEFEEGVTGGIGETGSSELSQVTDFTVAAPPEIPAPTEFAASPPVEAVSGEPSESRASAATSFGEFN